MQKQTVFVVHAFARRNGRLEHAEFVQHESERRARALGRHLRPKRAGVVVYSMAGQPEGDAWDEPRIIDRHGEPPAD